MPDNSAWAMLRENFSIRGGGLQEKSFAEADPYIREVLIENKREGLRLAVNTRWAALAIIAVLIPFLFPGWDILYYEVALLVFALIGWAQLYVGRVEQSRAELALIFCDLALMTIIIVMPNPLRAESWPTAFEYRISEFSYFSFCWQRQRLVIPGARSPLSAVGQPDFG